MFPKAEGFLLDSEVSSRPVRPIQLPRLGEVYETENLRDIRSTLTSDELDDHAEIFDVETVVNTKSVRPDTRRVASIVRSVAGQSAHEPSRGRDQCQPIS